MTQTESPKPAIDTKLIVPFINATREVFKTMLSLDTEVLRPALKNHLGPHYDVSGIIGFYGDLIGSATLSFSKASAINIVAMFSGQTVGTDHPDFADAVGELANMVAGRAKRDLGRNASITVPNVIIGQGYAIAGLSSVPCLIIPCRMTAGDFAIEVCIKQVIAD